jgi:hypothetical protein
MSQTRIEYWVREQDLNLRPSGYEPDELPGCSIPRQTCDGIVREGSETECILSADLAATYSPAP